MDMDNASPMELYNFIKQIMKEINESLPKVTHKSTAKELQLMTEIPAQLRQIDHAVSVLLHIIGNLKFVDVIEEFSNGLEEAFKEYES